LLSVVVATVAGVVAFTAPASEHADEDASLIQVTSVENNKVVGRFLGEAHGTFALNCSAWADRDLRPCESAASGVARER
jgi:hypothetical protein